jgi:thiamine-monophosphate kinase
VAGFIARDKALLRSGARPGDHIFVTGYIGDGRAGLAVQQAGAGDSEDNYLLQRLQQPEPRIGFGQSLIGVANACIDVSDGLLADVAHILEASNVGASIDLDKMPLSEACQHKYESLGLSRLQLAQGGDDYELCFTVPEQNLAMLSCNCDEQGINITRIGTIEAEKGLRCYQDKQPMTLGQTGYQHF